MASFIGSNEQKLYYNFKHKIAGSTVENPLKIYSASVNPSNLPAPTSTEWNEIKNQAFIDKLGQQDGNTLVETTNNSVLGNMVSTNAPVDGTMNVEIGGNTLKNEVVNGDFSDGTEGWVTGNASFFTISEKTADFISIAQWGSIRNYGEYVANHKYYICASIKTDSKDVLLGLAKANGYTVISVYHSGSGNYEKLSTIGVMPTYGIDNPHIKVQDNRASGWTPISVKEVMAIDLTAMFGAGNEPTKEWCDANLSYFDGVKSVGELEGNKIEALSCGKNLLPTLEDDWEVGAISDTTGQNQSTTNNLRTKLYYRIKNNMNLIGRIENNYYALNVYYYDINKNFIKLDYSLNSGVKIVPSNAVYYRARFRRTDDATISLTELGVAKPQLEEGTTSTSYVPYTQDKINILLSKPLTTGSKISGDTVTYADGTIEKLPQPLTLQSFANGTLQVNTAIPPYIKEWHTTNPDDQGVMQYQSGTSGLSQAFLTQIPLTSITNDIFGGSLPALKSAYKLTSNCDISAYGSGSNNDIKTNNMTYRVWNGTEYVLLNTSTSDVVSNINNILNNSNYIVDNNIYILMHTLPASDTIKSQINLDYFNANIDITRQPDNVIIPEEVKYTTIPTNYTIFSKIALGKNSETQRILTMYYQDNNNYLYIEIGVNNTINFVKIVNGVVTALKSDIIDFNEFQVIGIIAQQEKIGMKLSVLLNNGEIKHYTNNNIDTITSNVEWVLGNNKSKNYVLDGFIIDYQFLDSNYTNTECEVILHGKNDTGNVVYNSLATIFSNGKIQSGFILPNNRYKVAGQAKLYYNDIYSRTVENCEFVAKDDENKVELIGGAEMVRVD